MAIERILGVGLAVAAAVMFTSFVNGAGTEVSGKSKDFKTAVERIRTLGQGD